MKKNAAFFVALFVEVIFLFSMCFLCIYYLFHELTIPNIETLSIMVRFTLTIAIVVIPTESILLKFHLNKHKDVSTDVGMLEIRRKEKIHRYLQIVQIIFVGFWFAHGIVFSLVVEGRMNLQRGTDMYMFLGKPGNIIILSSLIGVTISDFILHGTHTNLRR